MTGLRRALRRTLLTLLGVQLALAVGLTLVDSYRRRGKKPKPFPITPPARGRRSATGTVTTYTFGAGPVRRHARRHRRAPRSRSSSRPTSGRATRSASGSRPRWPRPPTAASRSTCIYDGFANLVVSPRFKRFPADDEGARATRSTPPAGGSSTCAATAATTARSWSSTTRSASSAATTSVRRTPPSGATPTCRITGPGRLGPQAGLRRLLEPATGAGGSAAASGRCCSRPRRLGAADPVRTATCRGCGCSRSGRCTSRRSTGPRHNIWMTHAYFIPDQDFVDALKDGRARAGSTYACCCR